MGAGLAARRPQRPEQLQLQLQLLERRLWLSVGLAGRCGFAGHAVNPSLGARWRHPWRQRSCKPTPPRL
ncbi:conserved hypothetical protein [Stenotrophomonas geniculata]